jgi:hypothetical protein
LTDGEGDRPLRFGIAGRDLNHHGAFLSSKGVLPAYQKKSHFFCTGLGGIAAVFATLFFYE